MIIQSTGSNKQYNMRSFAKTSYAKRKAQAERNDAAALSNSADDSEMRLLYLDPPDPPPSEKRLKNSNSNFQLAVLIWGHKIYLLVKRIQLF